MKKIGPFAAKKNKLADPIDITHKAAVARGYVDNDKYPGLLTREAVDKALILDVDAWLPAPTASRPATRGDYLDDPGEFTDAAFIGSVVHRTAGPYTVIIPEAELTQGTHVYKYLVTTVNGTNKSGSEDLTFIVDRQGPFQSKGINPFPLLMPVGHSGPFTPAYFDAHDNKIEFQIQNYDDYDAHIGDTYELLESATGKVVASGPVFPNGVAVLTREQVEEHFGDGAKDIYYRLRDVSGNPSILPSLALRVTFALMPAPTFVKPGVRLAVDLRGNGDHVIDRADTVSASGMDVIYPSYVADRTQDNMWVELKVGALTKRVGPIPVASAAFPYNFPVEFSVLRDLFGTSTVPVALSVVQGVERGGIFHWGTQPVTIELDLFMAGPVNPDEPNQINPNLPAPVLMGAKSGLTNALDPRDALENALVEVTLWSAAPAPSTPSSLQLFYAGVLVDTVPIPAGASPGDVVSMSVPWVYIARQGNGIGIPLQYAVATTTTSNLNYSQIQGINVSANVINLAAPTVVGAVPSEDGLVVIGCSAVAQPSDTLLVHIAPDPLIKQGMTVTVHWNAFSDDEGTIALPEASGSFPYGPLSGPEERLGVDVPIRPGRTYIKPIFDPSIGTGSVRITYSLDIPGPVPVNSSEARAYIATYLSGQVPLYCDGSPWP